MRPKRFRLFGVVNSRRALIRQVATVTGVVVAFAVVSDILVNIWLSPERTIPSAIQTVLVAGGLALLFSTALAQANLRLFEANGKLARLAETDALTGLLNRRGFFSLHERGAATPQDATLVVLDIDHFKSINDRYGHPNGDRVLARIAGIMVEYVIPPHASGRLGGEEFAIFLSGIPTDEARAFADELRSIVGINRRWLTGEDLVVTVSMGLAEVGDGTLLDAYRRADKALYEAKAAGRDRVVMSDRDPGNIVPIAV